MYVALEHLASPRIGLRGCYLVGGDAVGERRVECACHSKWLIESALQHTVGAAFCHFFVSPLEQNHIDVRVLVFLTFLDAQVHIKFAQRVPVIVPHPEAVGYAGSRAVLVVFWAVNLVVGGFGEGLERQSVGVESYGGAKTLPADGVVDVADDWRIGVDAALVFEYRFQFHVHNRFWERVVVVQVIAERFFGVH